MTVAEAIQQHALLSGTNVNEIAWSSEFARNKLWGSVYVPIGPVIRILNPVSSRTSLLAHHLER
jgi:hypothetical protein